MDEIIIGTDLPPRRLEALIEILQARKQSIADELAAWSPRTEDDRVEYLVGFLDPDPSWRAMTVEAVREFPGAMARTEALFGEIVEALREVMTGGLLLDSVEDVLSHLQASLSAVRREAAKDPALRAAVVDFDRVLASLYRLRSACTTLVEERPPAL